MPFYKVPAAATSSNNSGPRRIRAPLRHSVSNGDTATASRDSFDVIDNDVVSSNVTASAGESKRPTSYSDQVHLNLVYDRAAVCIGVASYGALGHVPPSTSG